MSLLLAFRCATKNGVKENKRLLSSSISLLQDTRERWLSEIAGRRKRTVRQRGRNEATKKEEKRREERERHTGMRGYKSSEWEDPSGSWRRERWEKKKTKKKGKGMMRVPAPIIRGGKKSPGAPHIISRSFCMGDFATTWLNVPYVWSSPLSSWLFFPLQFSFLVSHNHEWREKIFANTSLVCWSLSIPYSANEWIDCS